MINIKDIYMRDPFVFVEDDTMYLVGTTDGTCWGDGPGTGFLGYKSKDMVNFEGPFVLFEKNKDFWAEKQFWAPELHKYKGKYYLVATFFKEGLNRGSQILVSDTPMGQYKPLTNGPFTPKEWMCLDATLWIEDNKLYTLFCHEWLQIKDGTICLAEFSDDLTQLKTTPVTLFKATDAKWVVSHTETKDDFVTDGPFIYKMSNGKLCMVWSSNSVTGYSVGMAISDNGKVAGPWRQLDTPLFKENGGHAMVFKFKENLYLSLHQPNNPHFAERPKFFPLEEDIDGLKIK